MCNDYYPEHEDDMRQTLGENLRLDVPWQPDVVIAHKIILCDRCKALRNLAPTHNDINCEMCTRKTYNWVRRPQNRQGEFDG
jgi:hypothetical protein